MYVCINYNDIKKNSLLLLRVSSCSKSLPEDREQRETRSSN